MKRFSMNKKSEKKKTLWAINVADILYSVLCNTYLMWWLNVIRYIDIGIKNKMNFQNAASRINI